MSAIDLLVIALAAWRMAYMVTSEDGPFMLFARLRQHYPENARGRLGDLLHCIWCGSIWTGVLCVALWYAGAEVVLYPFAASAAGLMLSQFTGAGVEYGA